MKTFTFILAVILLLSLLGNWLQFRSARDQELNILANNSKLQTEILKHTVTAKTAAARGDSIEVKRSLDSLKFEGQKSALLSQIRTHKKTIASMRPEVVPQIDSLPLVKEFVALQDSTITGQDSLIVVLERLSSSMHGSFTAEIMQKDIELNAEKAISNDWQASAENSMKLYQKIKKKKFSVGISGGMGVMSSGGEIRTGPVIQAGVQWSLWRF